jgi:epoxyqueuosine reductase
VSEVAADHVSAETHGRGDAETGTLGSAAHPGTDGPPLTELLVMALSEEAWEEFSRGSAIRRAGRAGFARNVCVAMGNWLAGEGRPDPTALQLLVHALSDPEPLVRGHAAWALGRMEGTAVRSSLEAASSSEDDLWVREELALALGA